MRQPFSQIMMPRPHDRVVSKLLKTRTTTQNIFIKWDGRWHRGVKSTSNLAFAKKYQLYLRITFKLGGSKSTCVRNGKFYR